jgi:hypothetical protein
MRTWQIRLEKDRRCIVSDVHGHNNLLANRHKRLEKSHHVFPRMWVPHVGLWFIPG